LILLDFSLFDLFINLIEIKDWFLLVFDLLNFPLELYFFDLLLNSFGNLFFKIYSFFFELNILCYNLFHVLRVEIFPKLRNFLFSHEFQLRFLNVSYLCKFIKVNFICVVLINFFKDLGYLLFIHGIINGNESLSHIFSGNWTSFVLINLFKEVFERLFMLNLKVTFILFIILFEDFLELFFSR
jgi:hypothetical protein